MKKRLALISILVLWSLGACATSPMTRSSDDSTDQGDRELTRGIYWYQKGCTRKAFDHFHAAHEHYALADRPAGVARSLNSLANVYRQTGDVERSILFYDAAIAVGRRCDDQRVVAQAMANKAAVLIGEDDLTGAEVLLDEAQLLSRETGSVFATILNHRAVLLGKAQRYDEAETLLDEAESTVVDEAANTGATIRFTRGRLMMETGKHTEALAQFQAALDMDRQAGFARGMADDLSAIADIHDLLGEDEAAVGCLERSIKIHALVENRYKVLETLERLEILAERSGADIRVTVYFVNQWLAGGAVDAICR